MRGITLDEARINFFKSVEEGITCPVCNRHGKVYRRKLNREMSKFLIKLYRASKGRPYRMLEIRFITPEAGEKASTEGSYLVHWGLVDKEGPGLYAITPKGVNFVNVDLTVPSTAVIFNGALWRMEGSRISIIEALESSFDYEELMSS